MKVYAVERGAYSDYEVVALFTTQAEAEKLAAAIYGDVVMREVYEAVPAKTTYYVIEQMATSGELVESTFTMWPWEGPLYQGRVIRGAAYHRWFDGWDWRVRVWGPDQEAVRRRWQEKQQQAEAEKAGVL